MEENDVFKIHVTFGSWRLPLEIARKDEELYRNAEKLVSQLAAKYRHKYDQKSNEELMVIVAYHLAVALMKHDFVENIHPMSEKMELLAKELDELLSETEQEG